MNENIKNCLDTTNFQRQKIWNAVPKDYMIFLSKATHLQATPT